MVRARWARTPTRPTCGPSIRPPASTGCSAPASAPAPRRSPRRPRHRPDRPRPGRARPGGPPPRGARTGPWVGGALCFLLLTGGVGGYLLLRGGGSGTAAAAGTAAASCRPSAAAPAATPSPSIEPAVSGSFLNGPKSDPIGIRVTVMDGSGTFGQAEAVLEWMQNDKDYLRSSNGGPAPAVIPRTTLVYAPDHVSQARALAAAMGLPASALHGDGNTSGDIGRMVLTLGQDFHGIGKPFAAPVTAAPSSPAPANAAGQGKDGCGSP
ncbi:LytR C-terminal domain-containing protein [Streptacidiphilus albus]|uniref:LytR C-terminal domain-containing protein n=1 Tax=Streptacidiphilus albus TaxID=105425 RepID=UPI00068A3744|nr:LytR C-terminal domain-containing protein [Streptacidiphilus albus]